MTLPYSRYSFERALTGIKSAGFSYVALGTTHFVDGKNQPIIDPDDRPEKAREVGKKGRAVGLEPLIMFPMIYPEQPRGLEVLTNRLKQASAAGIAQVLTFGHTKDGNKKLWVERLKKLGTIAADQNVTLVVKQHG